MHSAAKGVGRREMTTMRRVAVILVLLVLEILFVSWALASNRTRRSSELAALTRYQQNPTAENRVLWMKEQQITNNQVSLRKGIGSVLAGTNLCLIVVVARAKQRNAA